MKKVSSTGLRGDLLCISVCYIAIGAVLLAFPHLSLMDLCYTLGVLLIILGIISAALYFIKKKYVNPNEFGFAAGITCLFLGLFAVIKTEEFAFAFSQVLALCMIFDCIIKMQFSMDLLRMKSKKWWLMLVIALIIAGLAMAILINPFSNETVKSYYTYGLLIGDGAVNIIAAIYWSVKFRKYQELMDQSEK